MSDGEVDAVIQEAIMTPWWSGFMNEGRAVPLPAEDVALSKMEAELGYRRNELPAGYWKGLASPLPTLDFSDFTILVRSDLPDDVAYLLTWCLVETRSTLEQQYKHIPADRSPLSYPIEPAKMARSTAPLHPAAKRYYREAGYL